MQRNPVKELEEARMVDEAIKHMMSHGYIDAALELSAYIDERRARGVPSTGIVRRVRAPLPAFDDNINVRALRVIRARRRWTQKRLSEELGVSLRSIKDIEQHKRPFVDETASEYAEKLGMMLEEFQEYAEVA